jgi:murein DD-endopeptidase MepM/ murein hydrolase activator NlpD
VGFKKITIVVLPEGARRVRQLKVPKWFFVGVLPFLVCVGVSLAWVIKDYQSVRIDIPRLARLQKENSLQKDQIFSLTEKIRGIQKRLLELNDFDRKLRTMVNLEPNGEGAHFFGMGGSDPSSVTPRGAAEKLNRRLVRSMHRSLDDIEAEISVQIRERADLLAYLNKQKSLLASTPSIWPTRGWISSDFGYRVSPFTNEKEFHRGIDICNKKGAPILSPADGVVSSVETDPGYGKNITISHGYGLVTKYAHLDKADVKKGQTVKRGQEIAEVGNTGRTTGPHLHYEVHLNGVPVNPLRYILN